MSSRANAAPKKRLRSALTIGVCAAVAIYCARFLLTPSRVQLEQQAFDAIKHNDLPRARAVLLRLSPRDNDVLQLLADVAFRRGEKQECLQWLERLAETSSNPVEGFCSAGAKAFEFALPQESERLYRRAIKASPGLLVLYSRLARLYLAWQRGDQLRQIIAEADRAQAPLADDQVLLWLWVVGDHVDWHEDDSRDWLKSVAQQQPDPFATAALMRSATPSSTSLDDAKGMSPELRRAWPNLVVEVERQLTNGRLSDAAKSAQQFSTDADSHPGVWFVRGHVAAAAGDLNAAVDAFERASQLDPLFVAPRYQRGHLFAKLGRNEESIHALQQALKLDEFVQKCVRLLQTTHPDLDDLISIAALAIDHDQYRWAQLVCQVSAKRDSSAKLPPTLLKVQQANYAALAMPQLTTTSPWSLQNSSVLRNSSTAAQATHSQGQSVIQFKETTTELGLDFGYEYGHSKERWLMETLGGGVAVLDYDLDGWPDLFFAQGGPLEVSSSTQPKHGKLFRNDRGERLVETTIEATAVVSKYSHGCAVGDFDNDGFPDLLITHYGGATLLANCGDGTWIDRSESLGLDGDSSTSAVKANTRWNTSATFSDLDRDGQLDLYIAGYCHAPLSRELRTCREGNQFSPCRPGSYPAEPDTLFMNDGHGRFHDRSHELGIEADAGYGLGVIAADFDQDGLPEIFVGNDTTQNFLWHRKTVTTRSHLAAPFSEVGLISGVAVDGSGRAEACMGIACGDFDGDQQLDLFVTNFFDETCTLYQNLGGLQFEDRTQQSGLWNAGRRLMGWGCQFFDADNDGWLDLVILNGHLHDMPQLPQFYRNERGRFQEQSSSVGHFFSAPKLGRSVAVCDYNRDGRPDFVVSNQTEPACVLRNDSEAKHQITVRLVGKNSVRDATGAIIHARIGDRKIVRLVSSQGGYLSANMPDVIIGLGDAATLDELTIEWPNGAQDRHVNVAADQSLVVREGSDQIIPIHVDQ